MLMVLLIMLTMMLIMLMMLMRLKMIVMLMKDFYKLKSPDAVMMSRKNQVPHTPPAPPSCYFLAPSPRSPPSLPPSSAQLGRLSRRALPRSARVRASVP